MSCRSHVFPVLTALFVLAVLATSGAVAWRARPVVDGDLPRLDVVVVSRTYGLGHLDEHLPADSASEEVDGRSVLVGKHHDALLRGEAPSIAYDVPAFLVHEEFRTSAQRRWTCPEGEVPCIDGYPTSGEHLDLLRAVTPPRTMSHPSCVVSVGSGDASQDRRGVRQDQRCARLLG